MKDKKNIIIYIRQAQMTYNIIIYYNCRKRVEELITTLDKKQDTHRETLEKYQQMFQQAQIKASFSQPKA